MALVLVHGNPETAAIWDDLREQLGRDDVIALSPPGFGAPVPDGFAATSDEYAAWLATEVAKLPPPLDLVGHDWGGGHVMRLVIAQPELVRSWAMDIAGCFDPEYVWHERARVWQTPGAGETAIEQQLAIPKDRLTDGYQRAGMSPAAARSCAEAYTPEMGRCILALYRSAAQPRMAEWGEQLDRVRVRPGLVIIPTEDHYTGGETLARRSAERAGAQVALLDGLRPLVDVPGPSPGCREAERVSRKRRVGRTWDGPFSALTDKCRQASIGHPAQLRANYDGASAVHA